MISLNKITKVYNDKAVVNNFSLEVDRGEMCVLIGPSGCGKTTTLRMINRMIEPTSGEIFIDSRDVKKIKPDLLRRSIGYAIQMVGLFPHMTVAANIAVVPQLLRWEKKKIKNRIDELLILVGLSPAEYSSKYPYQLSGGEAQRIGVARALAANPPILLMDEPFGAVDPLTRTKLQTQFLNIQKELHKTIILITHDLDEAIRMADRIAIMKDGELVQYDTPENILSRPYNQFVYKFVGTDRALKRLSRINISKFIKSAPSVDEDFSMDKVNQACEKCRWVWVTDSKHRLIGWIDRKILSQTTSIKEALVPVSLDEIAVTEGASLKEVLSIMLSSGLRTIPVTDKKGFLIGEIDMSIIERISAESINHYEKS
ncbi:ABC transporter ATP-binding protein [bacterium]|nr:ABC transporter ATP-binding protein [bacterium]